MVAGSSTTQSSRFQILPPAFSKDGRREAEEVVPAVGAEEDGKEQIKGQIRSEKGEVQDSVSQGQGQEQQKARVETAKENEKREHPCARMAWRLTTWGLKGKLL